MVVEEEVRDLKQEKDSISCSWLKDGEGYMQKRCLGQSLGAESKLAHSQQQGGNFNPRTARNQIWLIAEMSLREKVKLQRRIQLAHTLLSVL